jgi:amino acid adenylation domain-containing protein
MATELYAATPFQHWLASTGMELSGWDNCGAVILPVSLAEATARAQAALAGFWMARAALVRDARHGAVLLIGDDAAGAPAAAAPARTDVLASGLSVVAAPETAAGCQISIRIPGALADAPTVRLVQRAVAGDATADGSGEVALRYARWQHSMASPAEPPGAPGRSPAAGPAADAERAGLWWERPGASPGADATAAVALDGPAVTTVHTVAAELGVPPHAILMGCWRAVLRAMDAAGIVWVAVDGRQGPVPAAAAGPLTAYQPWAAADGQDGPAPLAGIVQDAAAWLAQAAVKQPAWGVGAALAARPLLAYSAVAPRQEVAVAGGKAVLLPPGPARFGALLEVAAGVSADRIDLAVSFDAGRVHPDDVRAALSSLGEAIEDLPAHAAGRRPWRGVRRPGDGAPMVPASPPAGSGRPAPPADLWRRLCEHAAAHPDAPAVGSDDGRLSYRELTSRAAAVARWLARAGIRPGDRVGLLLEESPDLLVAMVGAYRAGAAYVPLHRQLPPARLATMLTAAGAALTVTTPALAGLLPAGSRVLSLDDAPRPAGADRAFTATADPAGPADPADGLAYVLFTSGSTGTPKGVMVGRRALGNYLGWAARDYPFGAGAGVICHSPPTFDLSVTALLAPLMAGDYVHIVPSAAGLGALRTAMRQLGDVSLIKLTPSQLSLLSAGDEGVGVTVRAIVVGGEDLPADVVARWRQRHPECAVFNEYGPTETVVGCTVFRVDGRDSGLATIPIGTAIDGMRVYVLDEALRPVHRGVPGELFIAGAGMAWGYAGDPRRTAERFLPDPGGPPGSVMYRSGDVVADVASCGLRFGGRRDRQVKLHGYRIEPGEVEHRLRAVPGVADAAVRVETLPSGERTLVAYVSPAPGGAIDGAAVRRELARELPGYLIPGLVRVLAALPLTASGKLDERALPGWEPPPAPPSGPMTPTEALVRGVWLEVLGQAPSGLDTPFFEVGGTSYTLIKSNALLCEQLRRDIPIAEMFAYPTIRALAAFLDGAAADADADAATAGAGARGRRAGLRQLSSRREERW